MIMEKATTIAYVLMISWVSVVVLFNIMKYLLDKQRMELYLHHLKYEHIQIIEHRLKPIYLEDRFMYDSRCMPKQAIEQEIKNSINKISRHQNFLDCCQVKERQINEYGTKVVDVKICIIPLNQ